MGGYFMSNSLEGKKISNMKEKNDQKETVQIFFGSKNDSTVYSKIVSSLEELKLPCKAYSISAHRSPELLFEVLVKNKSKVIIAGAGLAAHLPGVIASKTVRPVIGVPVKSALEGLDSFLSILQMPPNIPVLTVGVEKTQVAAEYAKLMLEEYNSVRIIIDDEKLQSKFSDKINVCENVLREYCIPFETVVAEDFDTDKINIHFVDVEKSYVVTNALVITVPLSKDFNNMELARTMIENIGSSLWVGLNRSENAAIGAAQIIAINNKKIEKILLDKREENKKKIRDENDI